MPKTLFKVYFWVLLGLVLFSFFLGLSDETDPFGWVILELMIYSVVLLGVYGYAFDRKFSSQRYWRLFVPAVFFYDVYSLIYDVSWTIDSSDEMFIELSLLFVVVVPLFAIQYLALYRYAYRAGEIWTKED